MGLPKRYRPADAEPEIQQHWDACGAHAFDRNSSAPVFSIDTPPPTVSGELHLGHCYSYSHTDFIARYRRMSGDNVFYPMGFDDNGLPTERLVERRLGLRATDVGREAFVGRCREVASDAVRDYEALWRRLALSIDWRYTYRTIEESSRCTSQRLFLDLLERGLAYRAEAPTIWCPECRTAIAQAELSDLERDSTFYTLAFELDDSRPGPLSIATTRPELLPACVAVFVHPDDSRHADLVGATATVPLFGQQVPVIADEGADPEKGTGAVMCCTFGDAADVEWWRAHGLPRVQLLGPDGRLTGAAAGEYAGLTAGKARAAIVDELGGRDAITAQAPSAQSVRVHERCDTPVEYLVTQQWFVRLLDDIEDLLASGAEVSWHPPHMHGRYQEWVANLGWDWCISRQRYFGVPFPVWLCEDCGSIVAADESRLPVDPEIDDPPGPCECGGRSLRPESDVMDTWATSSLTPQIAGRWLDDPELYQLVFPFSMRPQAHEIIRTWAFYTIARSRLHFDALPWTDAMISGWGLAPEGTGKISKSRGGGPMSPDAMFERYSADAVRYWAASTGPGKDAVISEEKVQSGAKLATKLWNVARLAERFLDGYAPPDQVPALSPADRWILSRTQDVITRATAAFEAFDYAAALHATETFFWRDLADNYLEMAKGRLYDAEKPGHDGARYALRAALLSTLKLFAPFMPHVTDVVYRDLFKESTPQRWDTIHRAAWPVADPRLSDPASEAVGEAIVGIATLVRRYKSENELSLGAELAALVLVTGEPALAQALDDARGDLASVTRAASIEIAAEQGSVAAGDVVTLGDAGLVKVGILPAAGQQ